jgi:hypothetical protein
MRLLEKLFQIISAVIPAPTISEKEAEMLSRLDPDKFYVENVRSILNVSYEAAVRICETAVRQGVFERRVEVLCPDGAVATSAENEADLPEMVRCWHEEDGLVEPEELLTKTLEKTVFYRLHEHPDSVPYGQTA